MSWKPSPRAYKRFWDAHAWAGVVSSVVLFSIFFFGVFSLFWQHLEPWTEPHLRERIATDPMVLAQHGQSALARVMAGEETPFWYGVFPGSEHQDYLRTWAAWADGSDTIGWLDPRTGEPVPRTSELAYYLHGMHFLEHLPKGLLISGLAAVVLLFLILTGVLIQVGRILRQLVQFRPRGNLRVVWSDGHKVVGVIALPFMFVLALTGANMSLHQPTHDAVTDLTFGGDHDRMAVAEGWYKPPTPAGETDQLPRIAPAVETYRQAYPDSELTWIAVWLPGDEGVELTVGGERDGRLNVDTAIKFDLEGNQLWSRKETEGMAFTSIAAPLQSMHIVEWAGMGTRITYAILSLLVAFCILTGNLLWLERREQTGKRRGNRLLAGLTVAGCAGPVVATATAFLANQLLPLALPDRAGVEIALFWTGWGAATVAAFALPSAARASRWLLGCAAVGFLALPLVDGAIHGRLPFAPSTPHILGAEIGTVALAAACAATVWAIGRVAPLGVGGAPARGDGNKGENPFQGKPGGIRMGHGSDNGRGGSP